MMVEGVQLRLRLWLRRRVATATATATATAPAWSLRQPETSGNEETRAKMQISNGAHFVTNAHHASADRRTGDQSAIFTSNLPKFLPSSIPMNASGAFSNPSTTSSR